MYRLLTIKRLRIEHSRVNVWPSKKHVVGLTDFVGGAIVGRRDTKRQLLQPAEIKTFCNEFPKAVYCHLQQNSQIKNSLGHCKSVECGIPKTNNGSNTCHLFAARAQSTTTTSVDLQVKKKKFVKPRYSKYVDLLEVTDTAVNECKSRVKSLKSKKLQSFINRTQKEIKKKMADRKAKMNSQPVSSRTSKKKSPAAASIIQPVEYQKLNMEPLDNSLLGSAYDDTPMIFFGKGEETISKQILDNPEKSQQILKSFHNFRDVIESLKYDNMGMDDYRIIAKHSGQEDFIDHLNSSKSYVSPDIIDDAEYNCENASDEALDKILPRFKSKIHHNETQERLAKERALRINLTTYLNVCVSVGLQNRGFSTLLAYRQRAQKHDSKSNMITIDLYNILLHGYAENGSFDRFEHIFTLMREDGLPFNEQTFAAVFECLGRLEESEENIKKIETYLKKAEDMNMTVNQIMDRAKFSGDQRDVALNAIKRVKPDFIPIYTPPVLEYNNPLLNSLNEKAKENENEKAAKMNSKTSYSKKLLERLAKEQLKIELDNCITIKSIEKPKEFSNAEFCREKLQGLEAQWRSQIADAVTRDMNTLKAQVRYKPQGYMNYYTYLKTLNAADFVDILIKEIYKLAEGSETYSPTVGQLYKELGKKVQQRYQIGQKTQNGTLEKICEIYSEYCDVWDRGMSSNNARQIWQRLVHEKRSSGPSMDLVELSWPVTVLTGVGRFLYNILMRDIKIDAFVMRQNQKNHNLLPAFYTLFRNQGRVVKEEVKPHPVLSRLLRASRQQTLTFDSNLVPMLCPPQPWTTPYNGGYLLNKSDLMRLPHQAVQQWERINSIPTQNIYPALDSLNQLASVPWRVNTDILDIIIDVFQKGGDNKLDVPQPPSSLPPLPSVPEKNSNLSSADHAKLFKEKMLHRRKQAEMYSLWCDTLYRLSLANHYRDKVFWLPHNMDFRGRVYPLPPHLNHLGSDLARSLLIFDQSQPLGTDGFSWLKLHCINLTGLKKRDSVRERLLYAEEVMSEILDSADNPLTGRKWWTKSDEPWQTLSCCIEIAKVLRSGKPEEYESRFPIHQDGSCNGLQHYAALGRDKAGAISVNLSPSPVPQDVYSAVAALVEKTRKQEAKSGLQVAQALDGFVRRKVIKQTVMTTVYGVTRYGARLQIARQLKDIDEFPKEWVWPASTYLTTKTFESLREMFTSTREIQDWFTESARLISGVGGKNVEWVTPLGLPVVQPYNKQEFKHTSRTNIQVTEKMSTDMFEKPNIMKQKNAFPPNFIHSLDSSHMMLTSLYCERAGLTFISVHDCFWTHACTVPQMNKICREQFVALHSQSILEDLSKFLKEKYSFNERDFGHDDPNQDTSKRQLNRVLCQMPQKGDFDLRNVLDSIYFFS